MILALAQSSRVSLGLKAEAGVKHTHKSALSLMCREKWKGHQMLFCSRGLELNRCKSWVNLSRSI